MTPTQTYYSLTALKVIQALEKRNMEGSYCETKKDALNKVVELIPPESVVSWGGSQTLVETGILEAVKTKYPVIDRDAAATWEEREQRQREVFSADFFLMSSNAVTLDGKLVNIDGFGNRLAALLYGPKHVIVVAGMNKLVFDEAAGLSRIRNMVAPTNAIRLHTKAPCASTGICHHCTSDDCGCCQIVTTRMSRVKDRIKVILVGESLGY